MSLIGVASRVEPAYLCQGAVTALSGLDMYSWGAEGGRWHAVEKAMLVKRADIAQKA